MDVTTFIEYFRKAFGEYELPITYWYSKEPATAPEKVKGCFMKGLQTAREGGTISLSFNEMTCFGGHTYCGLTEMAEFIPPYVSQKENYKETPDMVVDFVQSLEIPSNEGNFINFTSVKNLENFEGKDALIFFANPDVLSGLMAWAFYDRNDPDTVCAPFGSGCSSNIAQTYVENKNNGYRSYLGMFDPSVRPYFEPDILSLAIPMSRFKVMYNTFEKSCLNDSHAWKKIKRRMENAD